MASDKEYLLFILDQLSLLEGISYRAMMGEYIIYYRGKVIGGIYDNRFLVKNVPSAAKLMSDSVLDVPYKGGKKMLIVDDVDDKEFLFDLFNAMYLELPIPKTSKKRI